MPNRIIKESICTSENLNELTLEQEVFFYRLITQCDDFGRMDARPQILRARCYPLRTDTVELSDIESWLQALVKRELIIIYTVDDKNFLQMVTWDKHQQKRAKKSKYPSPDNGKVIMQASDIICNQMQSNVPENREYENTRIEYEKRESDFDPVEIENSRSQVFKEFETEFGRTLSPTEYQEITAWLDGTIEGIPPFPPDLILHALKQAALNAKRNTGYIRGILLNWYHNGVKSVHDAEEKERQFQEQKKKRLSDQGKRASPEKCETTSQDYEIYVPPA